MSSLAVAQSMCELKEMYRSLAAQHHPDRGGCSSTMQVINLQYLIMKKKFKVTSITPAIYESHFDDIEVGDRLYINATLSEVQEVNDTRFMVVACSRNRQTWFDKSTGIGLYNRRLRASFVPFQA
ncbi:MAG: hypothetical protein COC19_03700 [SAR86 cluster bacterium]|uniref:J domain-containing protein n=1 Tax=SAR86 cluster bacterium TaxID=2030880 RepID=A0A2A4MPY6_9GAMM|nr:MAG: hypothetical protein COC19_03700 [SAR86 cluster bacterium]